MSEELRVKLLGSPAAFVGDEPLSGFVSIKAQALLYFLAATGESHRRDLLAALLWCDVPDTTAKKNLRDVLSNLRRLIGPFLIITRHVVGLNPDAPANIDSQFLLQTLTAVRSMGTTPAPAPVNALQTLAEAADSRQGEFLAGFYAPDAPLFEEWMLAEREHLRLELAHALEKLTEYSLAFAEYEAAEAYARRQLELDNYRETAHRQLLTTLALSDRRAEAAAHYETLVDLLWSELGLEPAQKTQELFAKIQAGETIPVTVIGKPEMLTDNLPLQLTSFVGREHELWDINRLLQETRFLTLTGAGGSGKTRLAIEAAARAARNYADGVTYVSLATTKNPEQVVNTVARKLNLVEQPDQPLEETLQRYLARKNKLLILDNFEHVLEAALLVSKLLRSSPHLIVLVTSREALNLSGEFQYLVPPMMLPDMATDGSTSELMAVDSISLFVQRGRMVSHRFALTEGNAETIARICLRLDGLPLAIELAAARIKQFTPQQMLKKLDDRLGLLVGGPRDMPDRQRTLRGTLEWSHNLLEREEQQLVARLAVFNGGRTIEAVEAVCTCEEVNRPLRGLKSLLNINLLFQEPDPVGKQRFYMLETIKEYAYEQLRKSGEEQKIRNRHLDYYLYLVEEMSPGYMERGQLVRFQQTDAEMDNIKMAFEWALTSEQIEKAARLLAAINYYLCYQTEHLVEGYRLNKPLLPYVEQITPDYRVPFLIGAAELAFQNSDLLLYRQLSRQAIYLAREIGDNNLEAWSLAHSIDFTGNAEANEQAIKYGEQAVGLFREMENKPGIAYTLNRLGEIYRLLGDLDQAKKVYEESLALCQETGEIIREDMLKGNLGLIAYGEGDYQRAKELFLSVIKQEYMSDWMHSTISYFAPLSGTLAQLGEPQKAGRILGACHRLRSDMGIDYHPYDQSMIDQSTTDTKALLDESVFAEAWAAGQLMTYEQLQAYVLDGEEERTSTAVMG